MVAERSQHSPLRGLNRFTFRFRLRSSGYDLGCGSFIRTRLAYLAVSLFGPFSLDGLIISNSSGFAIKIIEPCSAFHNTITTAFIWLSLIKIQRLELQFKHFVILAIAVVFVVLLNTPRIGVMAVSQGEYLFWHTGPGLWIVKFVMLGAVLGLFYFGLRPLQTRAA
jgi:preprotein translocase subunit SecG